MQRKRPAVGRLLSSVAVYIGIASATLFDALLHAAGLVWVGRYLGILGAAAILASFLYSLRKRMPLTAVFAGSSSARGQPANLGAANRHRRGGELEVGPEKAWGALQAETRWKP